VSALFQAMSGSIHLDATGNFLGACLIHSQNWLKVQLKKQKKWLYTGFFYFFGFIRLIRQINNIFIPLSFHWRTYHNNPDWNFGTPLIFSEQVVEEKW
jgi:hypothetical protein